MRWALRLLGWATLFSLPCWLVMGSYQRCLARAVNTLGVALGLSPLDLPHMPGFTPFDLALFVAMCLASGAAPVRARVRAVVVGVPILAALEVAAAIVALADAQVVPRFTGDAELASRLAYLPVGTALFLSAGVVWLALLGRWELPGLVGPSTRAPAAGAGEQTHRRGSDALANER